MFYPKRSYGALGKVAIVGSTPAVSDFHRWMHPEVALASAPMPLGPLSPEGLIEMGQKLEEEFGWFKAYDPAELAFFSCTSGSLIGGEGYDEKLGRLIRDAAGAKAGYTTSTAVQKALTALGSQRLSIVTPYPDDVNEPERLFFAGKGFDILNINGIPTADPRDRKLIYKIPPETIFEFAVAHTDPRADTLFLSCTGMRALEIIRDLEERLSIPVVTSNQTAIWLMGSYFGRHSDHAMEYLGRLFTLPCPL